MNSVYLYTNTRHSVITRTVFATYSKTKALRPREREELTFARHTPARLPYKHLFFPRTYICSRFHAITYPGYDYRCYRYIHTESAAKPEIGTFENLSRDVLRPCFAHARVFEYLYIYIYRIYGVRFY